MPPKLHLGNVQRQRAISLELTRRMTAKEGKIKHVRNTKSLHDFYPPTLRHVSYHIGIHTYTHTLTGGGQVRSRMKKGEKILRIL